MISLENVTHVNRDEHRKTVVLKNANLRINAGQRVALIGGNGAGKSTLLRLLSGVMPADHGRVRVNGQVSWPVGFSGSFSSHMSGAENVRFLARLYGRDPDAMEAFVERFADIGAAYRSPWRTYSSGQRSRVSMGASMAVPFDVYLIDEATSVGDSAFRAKADAYLKDRLSRAGAVIVSHSNETLKQLCDCAVVMKDGEVSMYASVDDGIQVHEDNMKRRIMEAVSPEI